MATFQAANIRVRNVRLQIGGGTLGPPISCNRKGFPANNGTNPVDSTIITFGLPNTVSADNAVGKIDYHITESHVFNGRYFFGNNSGTVSDASQLQPEWLTQIHTRAQVLGTNWAWIPSSSWVNEVRFGYNRLYQPTFTADHNKPASSYGINTAVTNPLYGGLPRINIAPFYIFPQELGGFNWPKIQGPDTRFQLVDHVSYIRGKHALKFGAELHHDGFTGGAYGGVRGRIKFGFGVNDVFTGATSLEDFFAGVPDQGSQLIGDPTRQIHDWGYASFLQDDWRVAKTLTLNLGMRYELNTVIKDNRNLLGNFDAANGLLQVGKGISVPYDGDHNNFAPRFGFAWDTTSTGKTVVRGGGGLTYETVNWESFLALNNSMGLSTIPTGAIIDGAGGTSRRPIGVATVNFAGSSLNWDPTISGMQGTVFPTTPLDCFAAPCSILGVDRKLRTPYVWSWTLNVQHALTSNLSLEVAYVGSHGSKLVGIHDINQPPPGAGRTAGPGGTIAQCLASAPAWDQCARGGDAEQAARPANGKFPYLANTYQMGNIYKSNYNGLQTTLTSRNFHGLSAVVGYTYSHSLDDVGANWDFGAGSGIPQHNLVPHTEYASSDFDIRHRFTLAMTYLIPGKEGFAQLLKGWQLNSIVTLSSA